MGCLTLKNVQIPASYSSAILTLSVCVWVGITSMQNRSEGEERAATKAAAGSGVLLSACDLSCPRLCRLPRWSRAKIRHRITSHPPPSSISVPPEPSSSTLWHVAVTACQHPTSSPPALWCLSGQLCLYCSDLLPSSQANTHPPLECSLFADTSVQSGYRVTPEQHSFHICSCSKSFLERCHALTNPTCAEVWDAEATLHLYLAFCNNQDTLVATRWSPFSVSSVLVSTDTSPACRLAPCVCLPACNCEVHTLQ